MPIYEYECKNCGEKFEAFRPISATDLEVKCPKCGRQEAQRVFSTFSTKGSTGQSCGPRVPT